MLLEILVPPIAPRGSPRTASEYSSAPVVMLSSGEFDFTMPQAQEGGCIKGEGGQQ